MATSYATPSNAYFDPTLDPNYDPTKDPYGGDEAPAIAYGGDQRLDDGGGGDGGSGGGGGGDPTGSGGGGGGGGTPPPASGAFAAFPGAGSTYTPNLPNGSDPSNLPSGDPNVIQRFAISNVLGTGNNLINAAGAQQNLYGGREDQGYQQFQNLYNPIWQGGGGYTGQQQQDILQKGGPTGTDALSFEATDSGLQDQNYLTGNEQSAIEGDPYAAHDIAGQDISNLWRGAQGENDIQRSLYTRGAGDLSGAVDTMAKGYSDAIDPSKLSASDRYFQSQQGALDTGSADMSAAIANPDLNVTDQYKREAGMTDAEVANTAALGSRAAGAGYQRQIDDLNAAAAASGETNPMAVAAMRDQLERESGADVTDAEVQAQLAARGQQRAAATGVQQTELGAGQFKTGAELNRAQALLQSRLASSQAQENTRLGAQQDISGRLMTAAGDVGLARIGTEEFGQGQALGTEANIANRNTQLGEYTTGLDVSSQQQAEQAAQQRQNELALNRQGVTMQNQANQFNRSSAVNQTLSNRYSQVANMYQQQQQEGRQAAAGNMQYQGGQANQAGQRQLNAFGTETSGTVGGSAAYAQSKVQQSANGFFGSNGLFGKLAAGAGLAKGGIITEPTHFTTADGGEGIMGEAGPEAIVPLNNPEPMIEKLGQRIGDPFLSQIRKVRHQMKMERQAAA